LPLTCWISGVSVLAPGLPGWEASVPILTGEQPWEPSPLALPPPELLPATERRRTSQAVRLALAAASAAVAGSGLPATSLDTVFATSNGDGAVVGAILEALADPDGAISPTQFHNSVHNAAAGYWHIAVGSTRPSISLGCHDATFASGLLNAVAHVAMRGAPVLFCAYDAPLPPPLAATRATSLPFAAALVLTPARDAASRAAITLVYDTEGALPEPPATPLRAALEEANPVARGLKLLEALAMRRAARLTLPLLEDARLELEVTPC